jgi:eukaryotic-like serine/threonine-protein kinase
VVKIHDHGFTDNYGYIAIAFFGRGDLAQMIRYGVTPGNVMFRGDGGMALVDGLSKRIEQDSSLTETGMVMGTPYCMSPEQTKGKDADARTDLHGAGVTFFEMLTGERPFNGSNIPSLLYAIRTEPVPPLPEKLACYQPMLERLLAKNPGERFQSADELISDLSTFL